MKARTVQFDARRDQEMQAIQARYGLPPVQPQRNGAGMEQTTTIDGVGFFLRALDLQHGAREIPSLVISVRAPWLELPA